MSEQRDGTGTGTGVWAHPAAEPEPEQRRCECGQSEFDGRVWSWRGVGTRRVCVANSTLSGYCPACGCRLSVVDGEPCMGEKYADLERDARRFRAVEKAMGKPESLQGAGIDWYFESEFTHDYYPTLGDYADALLGGETGAVEVSPSVEKLLVALALELSDHGDCPMDYSDWKCPATPETHDCESGPAELCWLIYIGLATTYSDAAALWARMEEAAHAG